MTNVVNTISELYNFDQIKEMTGNNMDFIKTLAGIFLKTTPVDSAELLKAAARGDWASVSKYAHKMKSTVDSMNMYSIKNDIRTLEQDAKNKVNTQALLALAEKVDQVIAEVGIMVSKEFDL